MNITFTPDPQARRVPRTRRPLVVIPFTAAERLVTVRIEGRNLCEFLNDPSVPLVMYERDAQRRVAKLPSYLEKEIAAVEWF